jgi:hypothetical protein
MSLRDLIAEWKARKAGRSGLPRDISRGARDIIGPTGMMWSNGWDAMEEGREAYLQSFEERVPPSIFVSQRDRTRMGIPVPLVERCIEDWKSGRRPEEDAEHATGV